MGVFPEAMRFHPGTTEIIPIERDPLIPALVSLLDKACDLPEREEKWGLLKSLTELLVMISYPPMIMRPENAQADNHQA